MEKIAAAVTGKTLAEVEAILAGAVKNDTSKHWEVGEVDTGATLTDFKDYVSLIVDAMKAC